MVWSVQPEAVLASAAAESAISAETEAAAAGRRQPCQHHADGW